MAFTALIRVKIGKNRLGSEASEINLRLNGRPVLLRAVGATTLSDATVLLFTCRGFVSTEHAYGYSRSLQQAMLLRAVTGNFGMDIGNNKHNSWINSERFGDLTQTVDIRNAVYGIDVFEEKRPFSTAELRVGGASTSSPVTTFMADVDVNFGHVSKLSAAVSLALRLRSEADFVTANTARLVLAVAAVEALSSDRDWSGAQNEIWRALQAHVKVSFLTTPPCELDEIVEHLKGQHRLSVNEGFRRLFTQLGLPTMWPEWRAVYNARSKFLHGRGTQDELQLACGKALALSREIILRNVDLQISSTPQG